MAISLRAIEFHWMMYINTSGELTSFSAWEGEMEMVGGVEGAGFGDSADEELCLID